MSKKKPDEFPDNDSTFTNTAAPPVEVSIEKLREISAEMEKLGKPEKVAIVTDSQGLELLARSTEVKYADLRTIQFSGIQVFGDKFSGVEIVKKAFELRMKGFKVCLILDNKVAVLEPLLPAEAEPWKLSPQEISEQTFKALGSPDAKAEDFKL